MRAPAAVYGAPGSVLCRRMPVFVRRGPQMGGAQNPCEIMGCIDQSQMGEGLREVAELPLLGRIVFFGEQPDVVTQRQQTLEERPRVIIATEHRIVVGEPEAAGQEGAFSPGKTVRSRIGVV